MGIMMISQRVNSPLAPTASLLWWCASTASALAKAKSVLRHIFSCFDTLSQVVVTCQCTKQFQAYTLASEEVKMWNSRAFWVNKMDYCFIQWTIILKVLQLHIVERVVPVFIKEQVEHVSKKLSFTTLGPPSWLMYGKNTHSPEVKTLQILLIRSIPQRIEWMVCHKTNLMSFLNRLGKMCFYWRC